MKNAIVVDVEATCTDKDEFPRNEMEIIEIGATFLNKNNEVVDTFQAFIKPIKHPTLTDFCKTLTTIKQEQVDNAKPFSIVMNEFLDWVKGHTGDESYTFYSWGHFDRRIFADQCKEHKVKADKFLNSHRNAKQIFGDENGKISGVGSAMKFKRMKFKGTQHRAIDDAVNISELVKTLSERQQGA